MIFVDLVPHELLTAKGILLVFKAETANRRVPLYKVKQHSGWLVSRKGLGAKRPQRRRARRNGCFRRLEKGPLFLFFSTILLVEEFFCTFSKFFSGTCPLVHTVRRAKKANESRNKRGIEVFLCLLHPQTKL